MKRNWLNICFAFGVAATTLLAQNSSDKVWTLPACMAHAAANNLQLKQQKLSIEEGQLNIDGAYGNYLPNINANANNTWNSGLSRNPITNINERLTVRNSSYSVGGNVVVFSGLQNYHQLQAAKLQALANQFNVDALVDDINLQIVNNYLQIVIQKENIAVLKAQYQLTLEQLEQTKKLVKAGNLPQGDVLVLEANAATDLQNITNATNNLAIAKIAMKQLLNLDFNSEFEVQSIDFTLSSLEVLNTPFDTIIDKVFEIRNEVKLAEKNVDISKEQVALSEGRRYPTLAAFVNAGSSESGGINDPFFTQIDENFGLNYGFSFNMPILNGLQIKNGIRQSKLNKERTELQLELVKQNLSREVYQAYVDAKANNKAYEAAQLVEKSNKLAYEYAEKRYNVGISNSLDYSQAKITFQNSQVQLVQAKYNLMFALKLLELYLGNAIRIP